MPLPIRPMLAAPGDLPSGDGWTFEMKWDGIRAVVAVADAAVSVWSRHGTALTGQFPELGALAGVVPAGTVLDAELVVLAAGGRPSFAAVRRRMNLHRPAAVAQAQRSQPATLAVFDVPVAAGDWTVDRPLEERREVLAGLGVEQAPRCLRVDVHADGAALFAATRDIGVEGVVAKRAGSPYRPGVRSADWVKAKHHDTTAMQVVAVRRSGGRVSAVLVAHADGRPVAWVDRWSREVSRRSLDDGIGVGDGVVHGDGPVVAVRHLATAGLREARIVGVVPRRGRA